uniref:Uncharacterized protein n=1 Tax=Yersinia enterocolitica TaxID=630 RepID=B0RKY8_YEREN|nr:hypothetical protein [Yersinia enterocolitica]
MEVSFYTMRPIWSKQNGIVRKRRQLIFMFFRGNLTKKPPGPEVFLSVGRVFLLMLLLPGEEQKALYV